MQGEKEKQTLVAVDAGVRHSGRCGHAGVHVRGFCPLFLLIFIIIFCAGEGRMECTLLQLMLGGRRSERGGAGAALGLRGHAGVHARVGRVIC